MDILFDLLSNFMLASAVSSWFVAQVLKVFTGIFKLKKFTVVEFLFGTGGMPSSHTAAVCAVATSSGMVFGLGSYQFAISMVLAMIVMRDAMGMRRQVGEHAKALNIIIKELSEAKNDTELTIKALGELAGHTPLQVFAGAILGIIVPPLIGLIPFYGVI